MPTFIYNGEDERTFPALGVTVKPGDTFEAPDDFSAANVALKTKNKPVKETGEE